MAALAERMKALRARRRRKGLRELRLIVPDARSPAVRRRVAKEIAALNQANEKDALDWIEAVYMFDDDETR
jgi:Antitoxin MazE-like